ncbi:MAG: hypothetical protein IJH90_03775 [Mogibacterium sp.]|nr:hypothetical protein [Mogibacterium sp.]
MKEIDTRLVYGFLDAGKTTYIQQNIRDDRFYKYGSTLIICFEKGEVKYDEEALAEKRANVVYYDGKKKITEFCLECIEAYQPDRIYVEMNIMMQELRAHFPECMRVTFSAALIDWSTMPVYYLNFMQMIKQMVSESNQVTFRGCPSSDLLATYGQAFRLMNPRAVYLRQDPMGYHEKAFGLFLPFSLDENEITITEKSYLPLWLDALDHPEHYDGKTIHFTEPIELRRTDENGMWRCGRVVMTCCMADLQFMSFELAASAQDDGIAGKDLPDRADSLWAAIDASASVVSDSYGQKKLLLVPAKIWPANPPEVLILDGRRQSQSS